MVIFHNKGSAKRNRVQPHIVLVCHMEKSPSDEGHRGTG